MSDFDSVIGANIQALRRQRGWTQSDLAAQLQARGLAMRQQVVARIEAGSRPLRLREIVPFAQALRVATQAIYPDLAVPVPEQDGDTVRAAIRGEMASALAKLRKANQVAEVAFVRRVANAVRFPGDGEDDFDSLVAVSGLDDMFDGGDL